MQNILIIGIGRLGLTVALWLEKAGYNVIGVDINESYVRELNDKTFKSGEPLVEENLKQSKNFKATTDLIGSLSFSDIIFLYVDTPSTIEHHYDCKNLNKIFQILDNHKIENKTIVIGCTVMPGYINSVSLPNCKNLTINYHPEFIAQGDIWAGLDKPDILLIGEQSEEAGQNISQIFKNAIPIHNRDRVEVCRMNPIEAEITKIALNGFLTMKISYANHVGDLALKLGGNPSAVLKAIGKDHRVGNAYFNYGMSFGGPCLPRDTLAFGTVLTNNDLNSDQILASSKINEEHAIFQVDKLINDKKNVIMLDESFKDTNEGIWIREDICHVYGLCYKSGCKVSMIDNSARLKIAKEMVDRGYKVKVYDNNDILQLVKIQYGNIFEYCEWDH